MAKQTKKSTAPQSDERNLVSGTTDVADIEGELIMIWSKYGKQITITIIAVVAVFLGKQLLRTLSEKSELSTQVAYSEANDDAAKLAFAEADAGHPLSGFAFKELADKAYADSDYEKALDLYVKAKSSTEGAIQEAAQIGEAMSLIALDKTAEAKVIFETIANDTSALNRQEAQFRLAGLAIEAGDTAVAQGYLDEIIESGKQNFWMQKALQLQSILPSEDA